MKKTRAPRMDTLRKEHARLAMQAENAKLRRHVAALTRFDVLKPSEQRKRRQPQIEQASEDKLMAPLDRLRGIALCRDLERNFTSARSALNQFRINVVGIGPKMRLHVYRDDNGKKILDTETNDIVGDWFNSVWSKECDFRGDLHFAEMCSNLIAALKREGGQLAVFDDDLIEDTGKILWYEADQLVEIDDIKSSGSPWSAYENEGGVIFDQWGRDLAYCCTRKHGRSTVKFSEATIFPKAIANYIRKAWRFNQKLPVADMLSVAADLQDLYEMRSKEMQSAKNLATYAGVVKQKGAAGDFETENAANADGTVSGARARYENLESLTGGAMEYLEQDDDFAPIQYDRPGVNFAAAFDFILRSAGSALGLSKTYTTLSTESSYTAFRGDLLLSWGQFGVDQKFLERKIADWAAGKAIAWGIRTGSLKLPRPLPDGWQRDISWKWPEQPAVDPLKEAQAAVVRLGNLLSTYSSELGPDWMRTFDQAREEMERAGQNNLPLQIYKTPAPVNPADTQETGDDDAGDPKKVIGE